RRFAARAARPGDADRGGGDVRRARRIRAERAVAEPRPLHAGSGAPRHGSEPRPLRRRPVRVRPRPVRRRLPLPPLLAGGAALPPAVRARIRLRPVRLRADPFLRRGPRLVAGPVRAAVPRLAGSGPLGPGLVGDRSPRAGGLGAPRPGVRPRPAPRGPGRVRGGALRAGPFPPGTRPAGLVRRPPAPRGPRLGRRVGPGAAAGPPGHALPRAGPRLRRGLAERGAELRARAAGCETGRVPAGPVEPA